VEKVGLEFLRRFLPEFSTSKFNCCAIISAFTILQKEKSENNKLVNNSIDTININDNIRDNVTPGAKNSEENSVTSNKPRPTLELDNSYPKFRTVIEIRTGIDTVTPILRLRG
jgi:hypothetical protein